MSMYFSEFSEFATTATAGENDQILPPYSKFSNRSRHLDISSGSINCRGKVTASYLGCLESQRKIIIYSYYGS